MSDNLPTPYEDLCDDTNVSPTVLDMTNPNPAYGGCTCECHRPGSTVMHCMPCCHPTDEDGPIIRAGMEQLATIGQEEPSPTKPVGTKFNVTKDLRSHTFASSIILTGISSAVDKSLIKRLAVANHDDEYLTIAITANGNELNFEEFAKRLENSIDDQVLEKAKELALESVVGKFDNIQELMTDLETRLKEEINSRLDVWEDPV